MKNRYFIISFKITKNNLRYICLYRFYSYLCTNINPLKQKTNEKQSKRNFDSTWFGLQN